MNVIAKIIHLLLKWFEVYRLKREQQTKQRSMDELSKNPHNWYKSKFGGVRNIRDKTDKPSDTDTKPD